MERETGIEPATNSLEGCDSTTELLPPSSRSGGRVLGPHRSLAGTPPIPSLCAARPGRSLATSSPAVDPHRSDSGTGRDAGRAELNGGEGRTRTFEATRATDLQSAAFDRSATSPVVYLES